MTLYALLIHLVLIGQAWAILGPCSYSQEDTFANCSNLGLKKIPFIDPNVVQVNLMNNNISYVEWPQDLPKLKSVFLGNNQIFSASFNGISIIEHIDLSNNDITATGKLEISQLQSLRALNLSGNPFKSKISIINKELLILDLSNCNLTDMLVRDSLKAVTNLNKLFLSNNKLTRIPNLPNHLKILKMSNNKGLDLNLSHTKTHVLEEVDFSSCGLTDFNIPPLQNITRIDLSDNAIETLKVRHFEKAQRMVFLNISNNKIRDIEINTFQNSSNLTEFDVAHNELSSLGWTYNIQNLIIFNVSFNHIKSINDLILPSARIIDLSHNEIFHPKFDLETALPNARILILRFNQLETIPPLISTNLMVLDLGHCEINLLNPQHFLQLKKLTDLNLEGNKLKKLDSKVLSVVPSLAHVKLGHNPWNCDCQKEDFRKLFVYLVGNRSLTDSKTLDCDNGKTWTENCYISIPNQQFPANFETFLGVATLILLVIVSIGVLLYCKGRRAKERSSSATDALRTSINTNGTNESLAPMHIRRTRSAADIPQDRMHVQHHADAPPPPYEEAILLPRLTELERMTRSMDVLRNS